MSGPSPKMRAAVRKRDRSRCRKCGVHVAPGTGSIHHRQPRQMGGTKRPDVIENLVLVCGTGTTGCHGEIESNRDDSYRDGWLVHSWDDPARVALLGYDGVPVIHG